MKKLAVFDFDHTIINDNSDTAVAKLLNGHKIPQEIKNLHKADGWTAFMQGIFQLLYENGVTEDSISNLIKHLVPVDGMPELIKELNEKLNFDVIIISDSNSYFIDLWLDHNKLKENVLKVFTNPAYFENGLLKIQMYHLQDTCKLSTKNLCKGQIMEDFIREQEQNGVKYSMLAYCGDGINDFCPTIRLSSNDVACVRHQYKCADIVKKAKEGLYIDQQGVTRVVNADVCIWSNGFEIAEYIKKRIL